jgi:hypothetical protein
VNDQEYTNRFAEVHRKVKGLKDQIREANEKEAELRETRAVQEAKEILDPKAK